jgi:hypothetical protein
MHMREACAHKPSARNARVCGDGINTNDGGKAGTEAPSFRDYNFTIDEIDYQYKSIIVIGSMRCGPRHLA